jgi:hypothetical protein
MLNPGDDNELDHLSREAAGRYDVPVGPDWQKMEQELDKTLPVRKGTGRSPLLWWLLPVLLLVGGTTYWMSTKKDSSKTAGKITAVNRTAEPSHAAPVAKENTIPVAKEIIAEKKIAVENMALAGTNSSPAIRSLQKNNKTLSPASAGAQMKQVMPAQAAKVEDKIIQAPALVNKPVAQDANNSTAAVKTTEPKINNENPVTTNKAGLNEPIPVVQNTEDVIARSQKPLLPVSKGPGWSIALLAGVDKSTVNFTYGNTPGYNLGIIAGYHFNDRFSLHTGAIYTQKNYKLAGEDFTAPKGSLGSYYKLVNVEGYCRMWEVPLQARYVVSQHGKNSVYLGTGLSSYFMTEEDYNYFFYTMGQPTTRNVGYPSADTHILSIAQFSAGFESRLSPSLSLQIEPYAKIPLQGVGLGDIKLSSFGINFSVQHRQPSKK